MDENKLLLAGLEDKYDRFVQYNYLVSSDFLNLQQQSAAAGLLRKWNAGGAATPGTHSGIGTHSGTGKVFLFGGYPDAERRQVVFVPDYMGVSDEAGLMEYFRQSPEDCPLVVLEMHYSSGGAGAGGKKLTHRDYLGSLLGEGIRREKLGDILVHSDGAQVIVVRELADYLMAHYGKAGRVSLSVQVSPINVINTAISRRDTVKFTVSSPRLDSILSGVFNLSRKDAQEAVRCGLVFVNEVEATKPDRQLSGGEKLVLRGKGKAIYKGVDGTSKKGKLYVTLEKFV